MQNIHEELKNILVSKNMFELRPVQTQTIPNLAKSRDVIVQSPTGTGKTLAFVIPIIDQIYCQRDCLNHKKIHTLIITPTRELALQIHEVIKYFNVKSKCFIGRDGFIEKTKVKKLKKSFASIPIQKEEIECKKNKQIFNDDFEMLEFEKNTINIIIGTPGRLCQIITQYRSKFNEIKYLILDEADKLLNLGFEVTLQKIMSLLPKNRATGLFTATLDNSISKLSKLSLRNPVKITINEEQIIPEKLKLEYCIMKPFEKLYNLIHYIRKNRCVIFFSTCAAVDYFYALFIEIQKKIGKDLGLEKLVIFKIHGKIKNEERQKVYENFLKEGTALFCTDLAARGIDFKNVDFVIQFDAPLDPSNFIHRSGRTARNGDEGKCILFLMKNELNYINYLKIKGVEIEKVDNILPKNADELKKNENVDKNKILPIKMEYNGKDVLFLSEDISQEKENVLNYVQIKSFFDEELKKKSILAFISYIRSYKEYCLSYIFNLKEINFDSTIALFFLEKVPQMNELQNIIFKRFKRPENSSKRRKRTQKNSKKVKKVIK